ncbi:MAG: helix-turn-helix domain-containing protein [Anaerolineae bacterium]|nr:helix-turn-helix domain-containing protein [Anaerolineae bacterium]
MALGETLRRAREARRISLNQAALETRIRQAVLEALEDGDFTGVPPRPFLRGLLRNYALYLHLDADSVLDEYDYETGHRPAIARTPPPEPEPSASAPPSTAITPPQQPSPATPPEQPQESLPFPPFQIPTAPKMTGDADVGGPAALPPAPETIYQVAPTLEVEEPEPTAPLDLPQEPPTLARRIGSTRIPEAVAIISIGVALFIMVSAGFRSFQGFTIPFATAPTEQPTRIPTATVPRGSTPTGIPTLPQTAVAPTLITSVITGTAQAETPTILATESATGTLPTGTPTFDVPADAQMILELQANGEMGAWVVVDGDTAFNGTLTNESRTFIARARMFIEIKNIENGRVFFQGTRILPRNQQERFDLFRAWFMSPLGTPVIVPPTPFPVPVEPTVPPTLTLAPTSTPTRTLTATATDTRTPTATRTTTPSATASRTATLTRTPSSTSTSSPSPTASATRTATRTATQTRTRTPTVLPSSTRTPTHTATPSQTSARAAATAEATITKAPPPSPSAGQNATVTRTQIATPIRTVTRTPTRSSTPAP